MKFSYEFLLLLCSSLLLHSGEFEVAERMSVDFSGVCHNTEHIIAYGTGGMILYSADKGNSWLSEPVAHDSLTIVNMINIDGVFYGICDRNFLIRSGVTITDWKLVATESNAYLKDICTDGVSICVLDYDNRLSIYDKNLSDQKHIDLGDSYDITGIGFMEGKLCALSSQGLLVLDPADDYKMQVTHAGQYSGAWGFKEHEGRLYVHATSKKGQGLHTLQSMDEEWKLVAEKAGACYDVHNGEVTYLTLHSDDNYDKISWPAYYKYAQAEITAEQINSDLPVRRIYYPSSKTQFVLRDMARLDEQTLIAVGEDKTIYVSTNNGLNWKIKCHFRLNDAGYTYLPSFKFINKNTGFCSIKDKVFKTSDGGITWLPEIFTEARTSQAASRPLVFFDDDGKNGFLYLFSHQNPSKGSFVYTTDGGETYDETEYKLGNAHPHLGYFHTGKSGDNYLIMNADRDVNKTEIRVLDSDFKETGLITLDSVSFDNFHVLDDGSLIGVEWERKGMISGEWWYDRKYENYNLAVKRSFDMGKTWQTLRELDELNEYNSATTPFLIGDKMLIISNGDSLKQQVLGKNKIIWQYDISDNRLERISDIGAFIPVLHTDDDMLFINRNYSHLSDGFVPGKIRNFLSGGLKDLDVMGPDDLVHDFVNNSDADFYSFFWQDDETVYSAYVEGPSMMNPDDIRFYKLKPSALTGVEENPAIHAESLSLPYPHPARTEANARVNWPDVSDISLTNIELYDAAGSRIRTEERNIDLAVSDPHTLDVTWNCSAAPAGLYFISLANGQFSKIISVVVGGR